MWFSNHFMLGYYSIIDFLLALQLLFSIITAQIWCWETTKYFKAQYKNEDMQVPAEGLCLNLLSLIVILLYIYILL